LARIPSADVVASLDRATLDDYAGARIHYCNAERLFHIPAA
jgi:hypothetical protein